MICDIGDKTYTCECTLTAVGNLPVEIMQYLLVETVTVALDSNDLPDRLFKLQIMVQIAINFPSGSDLLNMVIPKCGLK